MKISIFSVASGQILRVADVPKGSADLQVQQGESWVEAEYPDDQFYIAGGTPVPLPAQPSPHHVFDYTTKQWVDPRTEQSQWPVVRAQRNALLSASDWTQLPDVPLATKEAWATYRQELRDVTLQADPFAIVWPVQPGA